MADTGILASSPGTLLVKRSDGTSMKCLYCIQVTGLWPVEILRPDEKAFQISDVVYWAVLKFLLQPA